MAAESGAASTDAESTHAEQELLDESSQEDQGTLEHAATSEAGAVSQGQDPAASPSALESAPASGHEDGATVIDVVIPDLGSVEGADLVEMLVPVGGQVAEGDSLVLLESDKASMEVPAPAAGTVTEWLLEAGTLVKEGAVIARLAIEGTAAVSTPSDSGASAAQPESHPPGGEAEEHAQATAVGAEASISDEDTSHLEAHAVATPSTPSAPRAAEDVEGTEGTEGAEGAEGAKTPAASSDPDTVYAGPAVRKLAREFGVSLSQVKGTGSRGRILKEDLQQHVAQALAAESSSSGAALPAIPEQDYARFGAIEKTSRSRIDKVTANNMVRSWLNIPHVTQFDDADISDMERFRNELKARQRIGRATDALALHSESLYVALREHPKLKSSLADGGETLS